jgi:2-phosphosulfolactate phosphatase
MFHDQSQFSIRCEWGERGASILAPISDVVVIVDVLSFSTCVDIATSRGATVFPYRWKDSSSDDFAIAKNAVVATGRGRPGQFSLSPASLETIPAGSRLVLPSPNGSTLSFSTGNTPTICGCLRNARAIAKFAAKLGRNITVIPAGERWEDGTLRPCVEDLIGAGAIIQHLPGSRSPEAEAVVATFENAAPHMLDRLKTCASGRELIERGFEPDVILASAFNCSEAVPVLQDGAYRSTGVPPVS